MAKRYGRKLKRAHRILINDLVRRLRFESTACLYLPGEGVPDLESLANVVSYRVTEDGGVGQRIERSATVTIEVTEAVLEMVRNRTLVQFQGRQYLIADAGYDAHYQYAVVTGPTHAELELVGVAS